jgi:hypothetical protein
MILFCKIMDDMMHDVMMMHKEKQQTILLGVLPEAVTIPKLRRLGLLEICRDEPPGHPQA